MRVWNKKDTCWYDVHLEGYGTNQTSFCSRAHSSYCLHPAVDWCSTVDWYMYSRDPLSSLLYHDHGRSAVKIVANRCRVYTFLVNLSIIVGLIKFKLTFKVKISISPSLSSSLFISIPELPSLLLLSSSSMKPLAHRGHV